MGGGGVTEEGGRREKSMRRVTATVAGLTVLVVYLSAMAPGLFWRDSMEFCFLGHQLDIGHPAGSPAFSLLSKALSFVPLGSLAWRANWLSVLAGALTACFLVLATVRWLAFLSLGTPGSRCLIGLGVAWSFAFSQSHWAWTEVAEVYSLQAAILAALLWLAAEVHGDSPDLRQVGLLGFLLGLSCGVHIVQILYAPAFGLAAVFGPRGRFRRRAVPVLALTFCLGFLVFAYLPVRSLTDLAYDYGNPETLQAFINHLTGRQYAGIIHRFPFGRILFNAGLLPGHIWRELNPLLVFGALAGVVLLAWKAPRALLFAALLIAGHLYLYVKDWWRAFGYIPLFLGAAWFGGLGLAWLWQMARADRTPRPRLEAAVLLATALAMAGYGAAIHWSYCDRASHDLAQRHGRGILSSLTPNAVLVGFLDDVGYNVIYQQTIEKWRTDVRFIYRQWLPYPDELRRRFPHWELGDYDPDRPLDAERLLRRQGPQVDVFWNYGWEDREWIDTTHLEPHGLVYRLMPTPWEGQPKRWDEYWWRREFQSIIDSPLVAPRGYDWTAQQIYARHFALRAKLHAEARRWPEAEEAIDRALAIQPDLAENHAYLAQVYLGLDQPDAAEREAREALRMDPYCQVCRQVDEQITRSVVARYLRQAIELVKQGKCDQALGPWREARRRQPDHPALADLARTCGWREAP